MLFYITYLHVILNCDYCAFSLQSIASERTLEFYLLKTVSDFVSTLFGFYLIYNKTEDFRSRLFWNLWTLAAAAVGHLCSPHL